MAADGITLPAEGLLFRNLVEFINLSPEEFVAACPNPFLLQVPVEQPQGTQQGMQETQRFQIAPGMLDDSGAVKDPTIVVEPEDIMTLVRSRSKKTKKAVLIHMLAAQEDGEEGVIVGRGEGVDVVIGIPTVSTRHAELSPIKADWSPDANVWQLKDLGSKNGSFVDGQPVPVGSAALVRDRADVRFGTYQGLFLTPKTLYLLIQKLKDGA